MGVKPGFKQTELGIIPVDWDACAFVSFGQVIDGDRGYEYPHSNDFRESGDCLFLNAGNVTKTGFRFADCQFISFEKDKKLNKGKLMRGDVVLTTRGTLGNFAYYSDAVPFEHIRINSGMVILRNSKEAISSVYQFLVLRSQIVSSQLERLSFGSAQSQLTVKGISTLKLPLPPTKAEQEAIAKALSDADALIESLEQLLAKKRAVKQGTMQELLTGKKRLPGFSGKWQDKPLDQLFTFSGGFTASRDQLSTEGHCYLHYGDIHTSNRSFINTESDFAEIPKLNVPLKKIPTSALLSDGDIVFVDASEDDIGTSKHVVVRNDMNIPFISGLHTIVAKSKTGEIDHLYRRYCFQPAYIKKQFKFFAVGTKVSGISKTNIRRVFVSFPAIEEQTAIAALLSHMDTEIETLEAKLSKARKIKQGMMQELLTGRIRLI